MAILFAFFIFILLSISIISFADDNRTVNNYYNSYDTTSQADGVASAYAIGSMNFSPVIQPWQFGIGAGWYEDKNGYDNSAIAIGIGKRTCISGNCGIANFAGTYEEGGGKGIGAGMVWTFP